MKLQYIAQSIDPTDAIDVVSNNGVLGALVVILLFVSGYLLRMLLKEKDNRLTDYGKILEKYNETQIATNQILQKVRDDYNTRSTK